MQQHCNVKTKLLLVVTFPVHFPCEIMFFFSTMVCQTISGLPNANFRIIRSTETLKSMKTGKYIKGQWFHMLSILPCKIEVLQLGAVICNYISHYLSTCIQVKTILLSRQDAAYGPVPQASALLFSHSVFCICGLFLLRVNTMYTSSRFHFSPQPSICLSFPPLSLLSLCSVGRSDGFTQQINEEPNHAP